MAKGNADEKCRIAECTRLVGPKGQRGYCGAHYQSGLKDGSIIRLPRPTDAERFWAKVQKTGGCWLWTAGLSTAGYGTFGAGGRENHVSWYAHRWAYTQLVGPIPVGMHLDHLCRTPRCVRPGHLEAVTPQVNILRGIAPSAVSHVTNICQSGEHEFTPENTYTRPDGSGKRWCKACARKRNRNRKASAA